MGMKISGSVWEAPGRREEGGTGKAVTEKAVTGQMTEDSRITRQELRHTGTPALKEVNIKGEKVYEKLP